MEQQEVSLGEVVHRQRWASKEEQQCTCQDYTGLKHCICEDDE